MRTKQLFLALALPAMFAACSNEEFVNDNAAPVKGDLVELGEDFALVGQGISDTSTRGLWEQGDGKLNWSWLPEIKSGGTEIVGTTSTVKVIADRIGLCWTGELADGTGSIGSKVLTNYEFLHNGWLAKGQAAANFDVCNGTLKNGKLYKDVEVTASDPSVGATMDDLKAAVTGTKVTVDGKELGNLDANTGVFKTENKAIFGGSYIVYYPYNDQFSDAASLPAKSPAIYENVEVDNLAAAHVAKNTFLVGYAKNLVGGSKASDFSLNPLSAIISLQLRQTEGTAKTITKVALWSENGFVTNVSLNATKVKSLGAGGGETLYEGEKKTSATIVAALKNETELNAGANVDYKKIYLPILPTTLDGLKVVVYAKDNSIAVKELSGEYVFGAGAGKSVKVDLKGTDFKKNVLIAVDAATLKTAVEETYAENAPATVTVIGNITLNEDVEIKDYVTVEGGKIIVPENLTLTVGGTNGKGIVKSTVDVKGFSCCGINVTKPGKLAINKGTVAGTVNLLTGEKAENNMSGQLEFNGGKVAASAEIVAAAETSVSFEPGTIDVFGKLTLKEGANTDVKKNAVVAVKGGTIDNSGTFEVMGDFSMLDATGTTVAAAGKNFKNNGKFIDNVGAQVGGATQYMEFGENGDYICKVDGENRMNEAYENKIAASTIEIIGAATTYTFAKIRQHNNKDVNIVISEELTHVGTAFAPTKAITIGKLTVNKGMTINETAEIKGANDSHVGWATITVNGDIVVNHNFVLAKDVRNMKAQNLTVTVGHARFLNRVDSQDKTLIVSGTINVQKEGKFTIDNPEKAGQNIALVTCTKLVEGGTFSGKPEVVAE